MGEQKGTVSKPDITMFFPAYNEEENIPIIVKSAEEVLKKYAGEYEILVVVYEGSRDNSIKVVRELEKKNSRIKLVLQPRNQKGIGAAIKIGFENAKYGNIFYADSDNQFDLKEFDRFLPHLNNYEVIAGYRIKRNDPKTRIIVSRIYNAMLKVLFGVREKDLDCAFRLVKRKVIKSIKLGCITGLGTTEMLAKARKAGFKIKEVGVNHYPRILGKPIFDWEVGLAIPKPKVVTDILKEIAWLFYDVNIRRNWKR